MKTPDPSALLLLLPLSSTAMELQRRPQSQVRQAAQGWGQGSGMLGSVLAVSLTKKTCGTVAELRGSTSVEPCIDTGLPVPPAPGVGTFTSTAGPSDTRSSRGMLHEVVGSVRRTPRRPQPPTTFSDRI